MKISGGTGIDGIINFYDGFHVVIAVPTVQRQNTLNVYKVVYKHMAMTICTITGAIVFTMILVVLVWVNCGKKRHFKIAKLRQPTDKQIIATRDVETAPVPLMITCNNVNKTPTEGVLKPDRIVKA